MIPTVPILEKGCQTHLLALLWVRMASLDLSTRSALFPHQLVKLGFWSKLMVAAGPWNFKLCLCCSMADGKPAPLGPSCPPPPPSLNRHTADRRPLAPQRSQPLGRPVLIPQIHSCRWSHTGNPSLICPLRVGVLPPA